MKSKSIATQVPDNHQVATLRELPVFSDCQCVEGLQAQAVIPLDLNCTVWNGVLRSRSGATAWHIWLSL